LKKIRLIGPTGKQLGIMTESEAGVIATREGLDLVLVSPKAKPPVVKIMDYGKYKYEKAKSGKTKRGKTKENKFRPRISEHDLEFKVKNIISFLNKGHKVKIIVNFRGREIENTKPGFTVLDNVLGMIDGDFNFEKQPKLEGRNIITIITC